MSRPLSILTDNDYRAWRRGLRGFFRRRQDPDPDDGADETIYRVVKNTANGLVIQDLWAFARKVALNVLRERRRQARPIRDWTPAGGCTLPHRDETLEKCLAQCKRKCLSPEQNELIRFYYGTEAGKAIAQRKKLAQRLGISPNALRLRAHEVRKKLAECVRQCVARRAQDHRAAINLVAGKMTVGR